MSRPIADPPLDMRPQIRQSFPFLRTIQTSTVLAVVSDNRKPVSFWSSLSHDTTAKAVILSPVVTSCHDSTLLSIPSGVSDIHLPSPARPSPLSVGGHKYGQTEKWNPDSAPCGAHLRITWLTTGLLEPRWWRLGLTPARLIVLQLQSGRWPHSPADLSRRLPGTPRTADENRGPPGNTEDRRGTPRTDRDRQGPLHTSRDWHGLTSLCQ